MGDSDAVADSSAVPAEVIPGLRTLAERVGAPDFVLPWLDRFYDQGDVDVVLAAGDGDARRADDGLARFGVTQLDRAVRRAVLDRDEAGVQRPADFHARLEIWAMFEGWKDVPLAVHRRLADWEVDSYATRIRPDVEATRDGRPGDSYEARYAYVLLEEAETIIEAQDHIYLWPCDCRSIVSRCRKPMNVCLRFENDRGLGWEISRERARDVLRTADKAGLMHTADVHDDPAGTSSICNCCTDCCFPHLAADRLGVSAAWPVRRHIARIDMNHCKACGRCGLRCPFAAIVCRSDGRPGFDAALCRGCGLCATACSADAIALLALAEGRR
ncbi:MAG TPA: hypothetical protein VFZ86_08680 [Thermoleophilia bacterium]|nr:hypothetical protein [Thermoleophilia bacterium]